MNERKFEIVRKAAKIAVFCKQHDSGFWLELAGNSGIDFHELASMFHSFVKDYFENTPMDKAKDRKYLRKLQRRVKDVCLPLMSVFWDDLTPQELEEKQEKYETALPKLEKHVLKFK